MLSFNRFHFLRNDFSKSNHHNHHHSIYSHSSQLHIIYHLSINTLWTLEFHSLPYSNHQLSFPYHKSYYSLKSSLLFQFLWKSIYHSTISLHSIDTIIHIIYQPLHSFSSIFHQLIHILQLHFSINTLYINHSQTYSNLIILFSLQSFQPSLVTSYLHSNYSTHN